MSFLLQEEQHVSPCANYSSTSSVPAFNSELPVSDYIYKNCPKDFALLIYYSARQGFNDMKFFKLVFHLTIYINT